MNGNNFSQKMLYAKGSPQKIMTFEDCAEKFKWCAQFAVKRIPEDKLIQLIEMINTLEQEKDIRSLTNFLT